MSASAQSQPGICEMMADTGPMVRALNLEFTETTAERAVVSLPDQADFHNHVGGPHAGAMSTRGESVGGAIVLTASGDQFPRAVPLAVSSEIAYKKPAQGRVTATAELGRPVVEVVEVVAELDRGERPEFPVRATLTREGGAVSGEMSIVRALRPHR